MVKTIKSLKNIVDLYDIFILDQWGVMHDGKTGYLKAIECVHELHERSNDMIIISNSSKRKESSISYLPNLGFEIKFFKEVMTSGEMIWQSLKNEKQKFYNNLKNNCFFIYDKDKPEGKKFIEDLTNYNFVSKIEEADFMLGTTISPNKKAIEFIPLLNKALEKKIPFVCANPDYETVLNNSNELVICMGTIAELYKSLGGKVYILGKPSLEIYLKSTSHYRNIDKKRVLAIGDSLFHDIKGANKFGIDSLLITSGIHKLNFDSNFPNWDKEMNKLKNLGIMPNYLCSEFKF